MGLDVGNLVNGFTAWVNNETIFSSLIRNPFSAALFLTVIVIIVILANFDIEKQKMIKAGVYIFIFSVLFLFVHYSAVIGFVSNKYRNADDETLINKIDLEREHGKEMNPSQANELSSVGNYEGTVTINENDALATAQAGVQAQVSMPTSTQASIPASAATSTIVNTTVNGSGQKIKHIEPIIVS